MHRFYLPPDRCNGEILELGESDAHHATSVLRLQPGEEITVLNGVGLRIQAEIDSIQKRRVLLRKRSEELTPRPTQAVSLIQSVVKPKAMDWILQKATELGASALLPIVTEHCVSRPNVSDAESKRAGWETTVIEAAKQSNAVWMPRVEAPTSFREFLGRERPAHCGLVASLYPGSVPIDKALDQYCDQHGKIPTAVAVVVGPEGDLSKGEVQQLMDSGYIPITLGSYVLRSETAALVALTLAQHELRRRHPATA